MPAFGGDEVEQEVNKFLRSHRVLQLERHYVSEQGGYWAMLVDIDAVSLKKAVRDLQISCLSMLEVT